jgi:hypothetical protein
MRWLMCLRAYNLVPIAALMLLAQGDFSPRCSISPQNICLYLRSGLHSRFGDIVRTPKMSQFLYLLLMQPSNIHLFAYCHRSIRKSAL